MKNAVVPDPVIGVNLHPGEEGGVIADGGIVVDEHLRIDAYIVSDDHVFADHGIGSHVTVFTEPGRRINGAQG